MGEQERTNVVIDTKHTPFGGRSFSPFLVRIATDSNSNHHNDNNNDDNET